MSFNDPKLEIDLSECGQKLLVLILVLLSLPAVYNVYFHPLARVPGPFLAKISDLWHAYHVSTGTRHILLGELHKTYGKTSSLAWFAVEAQPRLGPLIRLGPNTVSVNTDDGLQKVFSATSPIDKSPFYKAFAPGFDSSFAAVGQAFKEKKSILSHAFAQKKLDAMETTFMEHTRKLCNVIATREEVELDDCLSALTIDILSHVCFGETFDLLRDPAEKTRISKGLEHAAKFVSLTEVGVSNMSLHRNPLYFEGPDEFIPERWLDGEGIKKGKPAFSPFSKGPRSCLGRK
ncbi:hypothetical protein SLS64_011331 [Diaporthe eres]